jgi:hypothetical protein
MEVVKRLEIMFEAVGFTLCKGRSVRWDMEKCDRFLTQVAQYNDSLHAERIIGAIGYDAK